MHLAVLHLVSPILGAEKSKVPFYFVGSALAVWAVVISLGFGLRRESFPGNMGGQMAVIAVTAALVLATAAIAVITSGGSVAPGSASTGTGALVAASGGGHAP
jgi:hypothetical protein